MIVALAAVGIVSGAVLVFVYNYSMPRITANVKAETERAIKNIFPEGAEVQDIRKDGIFKVTGTDGKFLGYAFTAEGNGYQGTIKLIVGIDADLSTIKGMEVLESQETPGLGAEIAGTQFRSQFEGLSLSHAIEYVKNKKPQAPYQIEAITGATISSRAVVKILNERIGEVRELVKDK